MIGTLRVIWVHWLVSVGLSCILHLFKWVKPPFEVHSVLPCQETVLNDKMWLSIKTICLRADGQQRHLLGLIRIFADQETFVDPYMFKDITHRSLSNNVHYNTVLSAFGPRHKTHFSSGKYKFLKTVSYCFSFPCSCGVKLCSFYHISNHSFEKNYLHMHEHWMLLLISQDCLRWIHMPSASCWHFS